MKLTVILWSMVAAYGQTKTLTTPQLRDKIEGGWAGQMIGVVFGAPTEFKYREKMIEGPLPEWKPEKIADALDQDDLYVDMTFAEVLDAKGFQATTEDFGNLFKTAKYRLWHANLAARRALNRDVPASLSGTPRYNAHANDIDFQIEADFIGLMTPGLPQSATDLAWRAGRVMNYGDGIYGGIFVSCLYAAAFFETNPRTVVERGLACLPAKSPYGRVIADLLEWHKQNPGDWKKAWQLIETKWNKREPCPEGALRPFNIDAKLNGAYIALGLLYGEGDFDKTIDVSTRAGQDSDCNPSSAAGVLGVMMGYAKIPDRWKSGIPAMADRKFNYTSFTFRTIVDSSLRRALNLIEQTGGRVDGERVTVKTQRYVPARLEIWDDYGSPVERIAAKDARWQWEGAWKTERAYQMATEKGAAAAIEFSGTGVILVGPYLAAGGRADVYLDGQLDRTVDVYPDEDQNKSSEAVWHRFGLKAGKHTVKLVVRGERYTRPGVSSSGTAIGIEDLVVFR